jgi:hypothetical protein
VNLTEEGLSLWYGTPDAPAPADGEVVPRRGAWLVVGAHPANPTSGLQVRYRVDGGLVQTAAGRALRVDYERNFAYYAVAFPAFPTGEVVEYVPVLHCGGRQVPAAHRVDVFPSKFRLESRPGRYAGAGRTS